MLLRALALFGVACSVSAEYAIMFDAGSSGTRAYIYRWQPTPEDGIIPTIEALPVEDNENRVEPGLSSLATVEEVQASLAPLLEYCERTVPEPERKVTPMYLKATAGMRLLSVETANFILEQVRTVLGNSGFDFKTAKIISGAEEGSFGWLTANYLVDTFDIAPGDSPRPSVGAMDLGGASTQITFQPSSDILAGYFPIYLGLQEQVQYDLYTHSFLRFGQDQARERLYQRTIENGDPNADPCFFAGATFNVTDSRDGSTVTITGAGNFTACREVLVELTYADSTPCFYGDGLETDCSINGVYTPDIPDDTTFFAVSAYFFAADGVGFESGTLGDFIAATEAHCARAWDDVRDPANPGTDGSNQFVITQCFGGALTVAYLVDSFGFATDTVDQVQFVNDIDGVDAGWTLGATLYELHFVEIALGDETDGGEAPAPPSGEDPPPSPAADGNSAASSLSAPTFGAVTILSMATLFTQLA